MKTTTTQITTTTIIAALKAGVTGIVSVISAAISSRPRWRYVVGEGNPVGVLRHQLAWLAGFMPLAMQHAKPAMAASCRLNRQAWFGNRPNASVARQLVVS